MAKILIVDDEPQIVQHVRALLANFGYTSKFIVKPEFLFEILADESFDLILLDVNMPEIDGVTLLLQLKAHPVFKTIPVVMLTGEVSDQLLVQCFESGAEDFINKPISQQILKARVQSVLDNQHHIQKIQNQRNQIENIIQSMMGILIVLNPDTSIRTINQATLDLLGYKEQELIGKNIEILFAKESRDFDKTGIEQLMKQEAVRNLETVYLAKDGREIPVLFSGSVMQDQRGEIQGIVCVALDLTERKEAEKKRLELENQLRRTQKLEAIGTLSGGIAHDFNNILGGMLGLTEILLSQTPEGSEEEGILKRIYRSGIRGADLVQRMLNYSRMEEDEHAIISIVPIVEESLQMLRAALPTSIEFYQTIDPHCRPILADPIQIQQIVVNLCTNAKDAMQENGGILEIRLEEEEEVSEQMFAFGLRKGPFLKLTVRDTGQGISNHIQEQIFDPFFTTKEVGKGTGLGLSIVHSIVKTHHGMVTFSSELNKGTTFHVFFPIIDQVQQEETKESGLIRQEKTKEAELHKNETRHILIVDDEPDIVKQYQYALSKSGYQVTAAYNGLEAFKTFSAHPNRFDLVITDQTMPKLTGKQLGQKLFQIRPKIPIILTTGYTKVISKEEAKALGFSQFLMKPVKTNTLLPVVKNILDKP